MHINWIMNKDTTGAELIALAGVTAVKLSECLNTEELIALLEFLGLLRHNLEIIKIRGFIKKIEEKKEEKNKI